MNGSRKNSTRLNEIFFGLISSLYATLLNKEHSLLPGYLGMATYLCEKCGKTIDSNELMGLPGIRCPVCGYRILYKSRSPIIREIKAR